MLTYTLTCILLKSNGVSAIVARQEYVLQLRTTILPFYIDNPWINYFVLMDVAYKREYFLETKHWLSKSQFSCIPP